MKRSVKLVKEAVKRAVKLDDEALCKAMKMEEDPKLEDEAASNAAKLEETDSDPSGLDRTGLCSCKVKCILIWSHFHHDVFF